MRAQSHKQRDSGGKQSRAESRIGIWEILTLSMERYIESKALIRAQCASHLQKFKVTVQLGTGAGIGAGTRL